MVSFTMLALALGYWANEGLKRRRIAAALVSSGAQITYKYQYDDYEDEYKFSLNPDATPPWLARYIGIDYCSPIVNVSSLGADNPSEIAELAAGLPKLRLLSIQETSLRDEDLKAFIRHQHLLGLYLRGTQITDGAVPHLATLKSLHVLNLYYTSLSPAAIDSLRAALPNTKVYHDKHHKSGF
jgi:hypothetical protein